MGSTGGLGAVGPEVRVLSSPPVIPFVGNGGNCSWRWALGRLLVLIVLAG